MKLSENKNFKAVSVYNGFSEKEFKNSGRSFHMNERTKRMDNVYKIEKTPVIDKCFLVDKGHKDGQEIHVVTHCGVIYVYNFMKLFLRSNNALVTVMIARPNQIIRLYEACNLSVNNAIIENAKRNVRMHLNH